MILAFDTSRLLRPVADCLRSANVSLTSPSCCTDLPRHKLGECPQKRSLWCAIGVASGRLAWAGRLRCAGSLARTTRTRPGASAWTATRSSSGSSVGSAEGNRLARYARQHNAPEPKQRTRGVGIHTGPGMPPGPVRDGLLAEAAQDDKRQAAHDAEAGEHHHHLYRLGHRTHL